jgi:hypothetical protein
LNGGDIIEPNIIAKESALKQTWELPKRSGFETVVP